MNTSTKRNRSTATATDESNQRLEKRLRSVIAKRKKKIAELDDFIAAKQNEKHVLKDESKLAGARLIKAQDKLKKAQADLAKAQADLAKAREEENEKHVPFLGESMKKVYDMAKRTKGMNNVKVTTTLEPSKGGAIQTSCVTFRLF